MIVDRTLKAAANLSRAVVVLVLAAISAPAARAWQCPGDAFEPNDTCAQASPITLGFHGGLTLQDGGEDYYRVQIPAGQRLEARVHIANPGQLFGMFELHVDDGSPSPCDGAGGHVAFTFLENGEHDSLLAWNASPAAPTDFIVSLSAFFEPCTTYDLDLVTFPDPCAALAPDAFEDNDDCASAAAIGLGSFNNLNVSVSDPDYYSVAVAPGELVSVALSGLASFEVADMYAWQPGAQCGSFDDIVTGTAVYGTWTGGFEVFNPSSAATSYVIRVVPRPQQASQTGFCVSYTLSLTSQFDPCGVVIGDAFEPNSNCASAPQLTSSQTGLSIHQWFDADWYAIDVPARSSLRLLTTSSTPTLPRPMTLYSGCGPPNQEFLMSCHPVYFDADQSQFLQWTNSGALAKNTRFFIHRPIGFPNRFCDVYDLDFNLTLGTPLCLATRNSTGEAARITATGSTTPGQGTLSLSVTPLPANKVGIVILSSATQTPTPFGTGYLCLAAPLVRTPVTTTGNGALHATIDWTGTYAQIDPGETWSFQTWFRDPAAGGNGTGMSEGLRIQFQ